MTRKWLSKVQVNKINYRNAWAAKELAKHASKVQESHVSTRRRHALYQVAHLAHPNPSVSLNARRDSIAQWLATTAKARRYTTALKNKGSSQSAKVPQGKQITIYTRQPFAIFHQVPLRLQCPYKRIRPLLPKVL